MLLKCISPPCFSITSRLFALLFKYPVYVCCCIFPLPASDRSVLKFPSVVIDLSHCTSNFVRFCLMYAEALYNS